MKKLIVLLLFPFLANAQHTAKWKRILGNFPNGYINLSANAGDTLHLVGKFTYLYWGNKNGTSTNRIVVEGDSATFAWSGINGQGVGFNYQDCNWWKLMNCNVHNGFTGTAFSITGKSNHFEISHCSVDSAVYAVWFKDEPSDHPCDSSYWFGNNTMDDLYMHDCSFIHINQDVCYLGSTDQKADRNVNCNGVIYHPLPAQVSNIRVARIFIRYANRSGIQISGGTGINYIDSCNIASTGYEQNSFQGTGISIGGNTENCTLLNDTISNTFNYAVYCQGWKNITIFNMKIDSTGFIGNIKNVQPLPSINITSFRFPTTYKVYNNFIGLNTANPFTNIAIYATTANMTDTGNCFSHTGVVRNLGESFIYDTTCAPVSTDTICKTYTITNDTIISVHYDAIFGSRDTIVINPIKYIWGGMDNGKMKLSVVFSAPVDSIIYYVIRPAWDSAQLFIKGGVPHDTVICSLTTYNKTSNRVTVAMLENPVVSNSNVSYINKKYLWLCKTIKFG